MRPDLITQGQWWRYNMYMTLEHLIGLKRSEKYLRGPKNRLYDEISKNDGMLTRGRTLYTEDILCNDFKAAVNDKDGLMKGPLVFKGASKDWPCTKKWNKEYFRQFFANQTISLVGNPGLVDKENESKHKEASMAEFIDSIGKNKHNYLRFSRIIDLNPELKNDVDVAWLNRFRPKLARGGNLYMFMGEEGSKTDMHCAIIQTLFFQVKGRKKWVIYAPNERIFIDAIADRRPYFYTGAQPGELDDPRYPLLKYAKRYEVILEEGDVLWFPSFYWHYVENLTHSIGVTYKFTEFKWAFKMSKTLTTLFFLATKPPLIASFYYNTFKNRDLLFDKQ